MAFLECHCEKLLVLSGGRRKAEPWYDLAIQPRVSRVVVIAPLVRPKSDIAFPVFNY